MIPFVLIFWILLDYFYVTRQTDLAKLSCRFCHLSPLLFFAIYPKLLINWVNSWVRFKLRRKCENHTFGARIDCSCRSNEGFLELVFRFCFEDVSNNIAGLSLPDEHVIFESLSCENIGIKFFFSLVENRIIIFIIQNLLF